MVRQKNNTEHLQNKKDFEFKSLEVNDDKCASLRQNNPNPAQKVEIIISDLQDNFRFYCSKIESLDKLYRREIRNLDNLYCSKIENLDKLYPSELISKQLNFAKIKIVAKESKVRAKINRIPIDVLNKLKIKLIAKSDRFFKPKEDRNVYVIKAEEAYKKFQKFNSEMYKNNKKFPICFGALLIGIGLYWELWITLIVGIIILLSFLSWKILLKSWKILLKRNFYNSAAFVDLVFDRLYKDAEKEKNDACDKIQKKYVQEKENIKSHFFCQFDDINKHFSYQFDDIYKNFLSQHDDISRRMLEFRQKMDLAQMPWNDSSWSDWSPVEIPSRVLYFGVLKTNISSKLFKKKVFTNFFDSKNNLSTSEPEKYTSKMDIDVLRNGASIGNPSAQGVLGWCYMRGIKGLKPDDKEAVKWFHLAADQGDAFSQERLGYCYRVGKGVARDNTMAKFWYEKAADQGHGPALTALNKK